MAKYNKVKTGPEPVKNDTFDVDVDLRDFIEEIDDADLIEELGRRHLIKSAVNSIEISRESICDYFGVSRHTSIRELMGLLEHKLQE